MKTVEQALEEILNHALRLPSERVALLDAVGRILAEDIEADIPLPPFDNSAVDGYAVRAQDTAGAAAENPVALTMQGEIAAGEVPSAPLAPHSAIRIMTGAPMPQNADAVVMVEDTRMEGDRVAIGEAAEADQHIRHAGEDIRRGDIVLRAGSRIRPAEVAMLATVGRPFMDTVRPVRVAVVSTGDELVESVEGDIPPPGKIRDSNRYTLAALVRQTGAMVHSMTHLPDNPAATEAAFEKLSDPETGADVIVTAGGVSVGDRDYVKPALEKLGRLELWRVAMKPGKPLAFGSLGGTLFFGLPGNPASALVTFLLFVRPALKKQMGFPRSDWSLPAVSAVTMGEISHVPGRREYVRAHITTSPDGGCVARLAGAQGSSILHSLTQANALLIVPEEAVTIPAGATLTALLLD